MRELYAFTPGADDLSSTAAAAYDLSLQALIDNYRDEPGNVLCRVRVLSGEAEVTPEKVGSAWPLVDEPEPIERRMFGPMELKEVFNDPRWTTQKTRAYWVWVIDGVKQDLESGTYDSEAAWVVEYFGEDIPEDTEADELEDWQCFMDSGWSPWPMTARTRFVLWNSLSGILSLLESGLEAWAEESPQPDNDNFMHDFPTVVLSQPRIWWVTLGNACIRLIEAMRTGEKWNPRTPAEEALIYIACRDGWIKAALQEIEGTFFLRNQLASLPRGKEFESVELGPHEADDGPDYDWDEVPGALAGDEDVEFLWTAAMDGIGDPGDPVNQAQGIGDYRAESWHHPFDQYLQDPEAPSALF
ncbi:hypothetical protein AL755_18980 [Arthrobacter sp. ERGS1:01]|nr:hypothetical protein AL755_18980 [Arthrobacter sp. ERGS1:01]